MKNLQLRLILLFTLLFSLLPLTGNAQKTAKEWYKEGVRYFNIGDYDLALESLTKSIEIDPLRNPDAYFYRAKVYESKGKSKEAVFDYLKSCELGSIHCAEVVPDKLVDLNEVPRTKWEVGDFGYHIDSQGKNSYGPLNVVDGISRTAWVTKDDPSSILGDMMIGFKPLADTTVSEFTIRNGYCKSMDIWEKNSRVKRLMVFIDNEPVVTVTLSDTMDEQTFSFGKDYSLKAGDVVSFLILETYPGTKYKDIAISELYLDYDIETPYVPMFRGNAARTGAYDEEGVPEFKRLRWSFKTGSSIDSSPTVVDSVVYVGSNDHYLYAIDTVTGEMKWRSITGIYVNSSPAVFGGVVYVGSNDHYLYAKDTVTGEMKWRFETGGEVMSSPAVVDGVVYVGSFDSYLYAIDASTGKEKWRFKTGKRIKSSPSVVDGVVYVGSWDNYLYAINALTGNEKWRFETGDEVYSSPAVVCGVVYLGSDDYYLYAIDASNGKMKWRFKTGGCIRSSPSVVDGVVYVGSFDNYLYAIDVSNGKTKWRFETGGSRLDSSPAVVDGVVYMGGWDNYLYAIDASNGKERWRFETGKWIESSPSVVDGVVYFSSHDGYVYAIE